MSTGKPLLIAGDEQEMYPDEHREIVLDILQDYLQSNPARLRRKDVIEDILKANQPKGEPKRRQRLISVVLSGYKTMKPSIERVLKDLGIQLVSNSKHWKLRLGGDVRYKTVLPCSGSDRRGGVNAASDIKRDFF